jgi:hypothetical protein
MYSQYTNEAFLSTKHTYWGYMKEIEENKGI